MTEPILLHPIGLIHTPYKEPKDMPIQPLGAMGIKGYVEIEPIYSDGLKDLDGFSHIILLYHLHLSSGFDLIVEPFLDDQKRGLFATRAPNRPNPIGLSVVRLVAIEENILHIENVDVVNGTPLIDIKPYIPMFNGVDDLQIGWVEGKFGEAEEKKADRRFSR